ncbi:Limb region 1 protein, partial [Goodea atripinnis]
RRKKASGWEKNLLYPIVMLILLAGTTISVIMVALNILYLLVDETAMPKGSTDRAIGNTSLSTFGVVRAVLEIILMLYPSSDLPFVCCTLHDQEQDCHGSFVYVGHSSAKHLPGTLCCFITFYHS